MTSIASYINDAWNAAPNTNTVGYLQYGSGTGSLVSLGLDPPSDVPDLDDSITSNDDTSTDESSLNPATMYLRHDLEPADVKLEIKVPDPKEFSPEDDFGHFADHYADTHMAVEDNANWGPVEPLIEMPSLESQQMHEL